MFHEKIDEFYRSVYLIASLQRTIHMDEKEQSSEIGTKIKDKKIVILCTEYF